MHHDPLSPDRPWTGLVVGVLGLGRSGRAATRLLRREGAHVIAVDDRALDADELRDSSGFLDVELHLADQIDPSTLVRRMDALVLSPGIPATHAVVRAADLAGLSVVSELELACRRIELPVVAVTGTNGKSTTATLVHHMFLANGWTSRLAGNIGIPLSDEIGQRGVRGVLVVEASSFQLERIQYFHPRSAAILNIAPDHLDRYDGLSEYLAAKARIAENLGPEDAFVFPADHPALIELAARQSARRLGFSLERSASSDAFAWVEDGCFVRRAGEGVEAILSVDQFQLLGLHNRRNALAALCLVAPFDLGVEALARALRTMRPLAHRATLVLERAGVRWIDDSKATNVHAARASLEGLEGPFILLLGGRGKGEDYRSLRDVMGHVEIALCYGEEAESIACAIEGSTQVKRCAGMVAALELAHRLAEPGYAVLLSPACASFDEFRSYEHRGEVFTDWVRENAAGER